MNNSVSRVALLVVATATLASCTGRTILHGMRGAHLPLAALPTRAAHHEDNRLLIWLVKADASGSKVVPVQRQILGGDRLEQAVKELLNGPDAGEEHMGLGTEIPRGTILLAVNKKGRAIELNLSRRFAMDGGTTSFETRLQQLSRTVAPIAGASDVFLDVEGKRLNIEEGEGIEIHQPINR